MSKNFAGKVQEAALPGYTVFTRNDAEQAAKLLIAQGFTPRGKQPEATSGDGQRVLQSHDEVMQTIAAIPDKNLSTLGYVLEANLNPKTVKTLSVGQVMVDDILITYVGKQRKTKDLQDNPRYGGTDMYLARGDFADLIRRVEANRKPLFRGVDNSRLLLAIQQAQTFDEHARNYLGMFGSRRNYDVVQGVTDDGEFRSGVTDQSWRVGGASGPEVLGLEEFNKDPNLQALRGYSRNIYFRPLNNNSLYPDTLPTPPGSVVFFVGIDPKRYEGKLTSCARVYPPGDSHFALTS